MIKQFFSWVWSEIVDIIVYVLPYSEGIPDGMQEALQEFMSYLGGLNLILPINTMMLLLTFTITFETMRLMFRFTKWVIEIIRGSS